MNISLKTEILKKFGSQLRFAQEVGIHPSTVSLVMHGWRELDPERQIRWAQALGKNPERAFQGSSLKPETNRIAKTKQRHFEHLRVPARKFCELVSNFARQVPPSTKEK